MRKLTNWFKPPGETQRSDDIVNETSSSIEEIPPTPNDDLSMPIQPGTSKDAENCIVPQLLSDSSKKPPLHDYDISLALNRRLNDFEKHQFLNNFFKPSNVYEFPAVISGAKKRQVF